MGLLNSLLASPHKNKDNTLLLLDAVIQHFPCFRDESIFEEHKVVFWKRAQILIAETWYVVEAQA